MTHSKLAIGAALIGAAILGALAVAYSAAQPSRETADGAFSDDQKESIRLIVRDYLIDNPEVLIESLNEYAENERQSAQTRALDTAKAKLSALLDEKHGYAAGPNPENASVAVVEFFDYHCGFCKRASGLVKDMTEDDPAVKVVFREFPILREESNYAAAAALAAREQGKYIDLHFALMKASGVLTEARINDIASDVGIDVAKLKRDVKDRDVQAAIDETHKIAEEMAVDGTPTFVVASVNGDFVDVIQGFRAEDVTAAIAEAKKAAHK